MLCCSPLHCVALLCLAPDCEYECVCGVNMLGDIGLDLILSEIGIGFVEVV